MEWRDEVKSAVSLAGAASELGIVAKRMGSMGPCPLCNADKRGDEDRRGPMGANSEKWHCWACGEGGDVFDLVAAATFGKTSRGLSSDEWKEVRAACVGYGWCQPRTPGGGSHSTVRHNRSRKPVERPEEPQAESQRPGAFGWRSGLAEDCEAALWTDGAEDVLEYLTKERGFTRSTLREFGIGALVVSPTEKWAAIPLRDPDGTVINMRFRRVGNQRKGPKYRVCAKRPLPLFGADRLSKDVSEHLVVVEGELDVLAMFQFGIEHNVVSTTAGAGTFTDEWLDMLEPYTGFTICYDNDDAGKKGATQLAEKLGLYRCSRATLPHNDAGKCLEEGVDRVVIVDAIENAAPMLGVEICRMGAFEDELERLVANPDDLIGRPTGSVKLDDAVGGLRPGLIILSGETGEGKTTFAHWLLATQARMGIPSMVTSLEQSPIGSVQKFIRGQLGGDFMAATEKERREGMRALDALPLTILKHRGHLDREKLVDTIRYGVRRLGLKNVLIDHLGFVIPPDSDNERLKIQALVRELSILGEFEGVTILMVAHPSNMHLSQKRRVGLGDLKGASAIRQDAHEVWIVEAANQNKGRNYPASYIHFDKIRSDYGASGQSVLLAFDPLATVYADSWQATPTGKRGVKLVSEKGEDKNASVDTSG